MNRKGRPGLSVDFQSNEVQGSVDAITADHPAEKKDGLNDAFGDDFANVGGGGSSISPGDFDDLKQVIGTGSSGIVRKVLYTPTDTIMALKVIHLEANEKVRKQIITELQALHDSAHCPYIVQFYGAFFSEGAIQIALEYMDGGCILDVLRKNGTLPEEVLGAISYQVLMALNYLHKDRKLIHRDVKPANLLINQAGDVKVSDFGESGQLAHTMAKKDTWVGTACYMSPERITGGTYGPDSDLWSLGLTLIECATGRFPYLATDSDKFNFWELMENIVHEDGE